MSAQKSTDHRFLSPPIYLYLKSGKVLDDKVIDGDVELDRYRIVNTRKKSLELDNFLNFTRLGRCQSEALQMGQEEGCPSQECLKTRNHAKLRSKF